MKSNIFNKKTKLAQGFTLIELLVVISIIGMLASVVLVSLQGARNKAKDAKLIAEVKELQKALELYRLDNGKYPGVGTDSSWHSTAAGCSATNGHLLTENGMFDATFRSKYIPSLPTELASCGIYYMSFDGINKTDMACVYPDSNGNPVFIHPDGYNANVVANDTYSYVFMITTIANPTLASYPISDWPDVGGGSVYTNPDFTGVSRCVLGPKR